MPLRNLALVGVILAIVVSFPDAVKCQTTAPSRSALTNQDVIDLVKAGFSSDVVLAKIRSSACNFDTSLGAMKSLKNATFLTPSSSRWFRRCPPGISGR